MAGVDRSLVSDPWAPAAAPGRARGAGAGDRVVAVGLVAALAAAGPALRVLPNGANGRGGAAVLVVTCVAIAAVLPVQPPWWRRLGVAAALAAAGAALAIPLIGRAPVAVALVSVLVAHLALSGALARLSPIRRVGPAPARAVLAVPLLAMAAISWLRHGELAIWAAFVAGALVVVAITLARPAWTRRPEAWLTWAGLELGRSIAAALVLLVLLVVLYLPGAVVIGVERILRRPNPSTWAPVRTTADQWRRDAPYPFASTPARDARRRLAVGVVLLVVVPLVTWRALEAREREEVAAGRAGQPMAPAGEPRTPDDPPIVFGREFDARYSDLPAYRGVSWADDLQEQEAQVPPVETFRSELLNVRDGRRVTVEPTSDGPSVSVWLTGGSAVWGIGQRDQATIASALVRAGDAAGRRLAVDNMGERGTVLANQIDAIAARLDEGEVPDVVVVYGGFNEVGVALADVFLRSGDDAAQLVEGDQQELDLREQMGDLEAINEQVDEFLASGAGPEAAALAARRYRAEQARLDELAEEHGFEVRYVVQADAFGDRRQLEPYEAISNVPTAVMERSPIALALAGFEAEMVGEAVSLRQLFDGSPDQVFLGLVHHNEAAAARVAGALLPLVLDAAG